MAGKFRTTCARWCSFWSNTPTAPLTSPGLPAWARRLLLFGIAFACVINSAVIPTFTPKDADDIPRTTMRPIAESNLAVQWYEDAPLEIYLAADFPDALKSRAKPRTNRPLYAWLGSGLTATYMGTVERDRIDDLERRREVSIWTLLLLNALFLGLALTFCARVMDPLGLYLFLTMGYLSLFSGACVTHMLILVPPALLFWFFARNDRSPGNPPSLRSTLALGLAFGIFLLGSKSSVLSSPPAAYSPFAVSGKTSRHCCPASSPPASCIAVI